ncbi:hypothetical protein QP555_00135 [Peptoniphilus lacrimalis]|uniref:hypothetical protein n=1 Tax=Peptoniphilus lacrimalis TaxID=33031 RepID=UPI00255153AB|nr:hypothetical protein [Peptoniphilus lacrimalis]MDK7721423.1 hypothetical protein [Peptoniphilus lacrimalis]MDK7731024.1 hypothetical protein [Peptoniphilus lacrimalis]
MSLANIKISNNKNYAFKDIKNYLVENFLYNNETDCINILLNIYNIEESIENIFPRYVSLENLRLDIIKLYKEKRGIELIARNLSSLIHDDINRLELYLYLEGYRRGFNSSKLINKLEMIALNYLSIEELYSRKKLYNYEFKNKDVVIFKKELFKSLRRDRFTRSYISLIVRGVDKNLLRKKIFNINSHLDLQLVFSDDSSARFKEMNSYLSVNEISNLYKKILKFLYVDGYRILTNGYWDGINDKVMKRYK